LEALKAYEARLKKMKEDRENLNSAKTALELADGVQTTPLDDKLDVAIEEMTDLHGSVLMFDVILLFVRRVECVDES
jgi:hypothetical protein